MIKQTGMECMFMPMVQGMRESGKMISKKARAEKHGRMAVNTTDIMLTQRKRAEAFTFGLMAILTLEIGGIMPSMEMVSTSGTMAEPMEENGKTI